MTLISMLIILSFIILLRISPKTEGTKEVRSNRLCPTFFGIATDIIIVHIKFVLGLEISFNIGDDNNFRQIWNLLCKIRNFT